MRLHETVLLSAGLLLAMPGCKSASGALPTWEADAPQEDGELAVADVDDTDAPVDEEAAEATEPASDDNAQQTEAETESAAAAEETPVDDEPAKKTEKNQRKPSKRALPKPVYGKIDNSCGKDPGVGQKLKSFKLETTKGKAVGNGAYRGRVMVVNFWGTWCKPCLKELPEFDRLYRRYRKHGMTLVAIATDADPGPVDEFVAKRKLAAKVLIGGEAYANQYSAPKFPFTFVVDPKGVIRASYHGYKPQCMGKLEADIRAQLEKRNQ